MIFDKTSTHKRKIMFAKRTVGVICVSLNILHLSRPYDENYSQLLHEKVLLDAINEFTIKIAS